ncbi:MAG: histidine kinase [Deltaproteobacteria bacterium]|jgi:two-component system NtrC family sensor kinase|nr:histidine kinase [Deltaproteobacteria bacterium]
MENSTNNRRTKTAQDARARSDDDLTGNLSAESYFRKLKLRLGIGLLISFVVPLVALSLYFHLQFTFTLKENAKLNLLAVAESQRNTVDLFLQERVVNILSQFQSEEFSLTPTRRSMENFLQNLRRVSDAFIDVGFLNENGIQIGYAGPFPYLQDKMYAKEPWFNTLLYQERNHFISDIYLGFRNRPHFTIGVKQIIDGKLVVLRSTLDPDKLYMFLQTIDPGKGADLFIINRAGAFQIVDPGQGKLLGDSDFVPSNPAGSGVEELKRGGASILAAYAWLQETPWALIVREPLRIAHAQMYRARNIIVASTILIIAIIAPAIWFTVTKLIDKARDNAEKREDLQLQLLHASKLASVGELATGIAHEINNPLAIAIATTGVIRDMLNPEFKLDARPENIIKELDTIDAAILRARTITRQLLEYGRKNPPRPVECNLNQLLDHVMSGFKQRAFEVENIKIKKQYDPELPVVVADPDQLQQVFLNLINNAGDAISGSGTITISTAGDTGQVRVTITDSGRGMTTDQMSKIFDPFYTTKEPGKGTGLGLSVSLGIVKAMGGSIDVQSMPGSGSSFTVSLPSDTTERTTDAATNHSRQE